MAGHPRRRKKTVRQPIGLDEDGAAGVNTAREKRFAAAEKNVAAAAALTRMTAVAASRSALAFAASRSSLGPQMAPEPFQLRLPGDEFADR
jgi:hypothetical protein